MDVVVVVVAAVVVVVVDVVVVVIVVVVVVYIYIYISLLVLLLLVYLSLVINLLAFIGFGCFSIGRRPCPETPPYIRLLYKQHDEYSTSEK